MGILGSAADHPQRGPLRDGGQGNSDRNRPWGEYEVNSYRYAKDKYWKSIGGMHLHHVEDPDFLPIYVAHGPGGAGTHARDFAEAVRFWTDGKHANHGFMLHGDSRGYFTAWSREAEKASCPPDVARLVPKDTQWQKLPKNGCPSILACGSPSSAWNVPWAFPSRDRI